MAAHMSLRYLYPQFLNISRIPCCLCARRQQTSAQELKQSDLVVASSSGGEEIVIPKRKKRDSLSILKALSSTVENDPLAPRYIYVDSPQFMPKSRNDQQLYAIAKASGRRAARRVMQEFPEAFDHDDAAPHIKAYEPEVLYYEHQKPTEEALIERINLRRVKHAIEVHKEMVKLGVQASQAVLESLLELVCVYNHQDPIPCDPEEIDFGMKQAVGPWEMNGYAERLFDNLPEKTANAYNALIKGLSMHKFAKSVPKLHQDMKSKNLPVYKETYLEMIRGARSFVNSERTKTSTENEIFHIYWTYVGDLLKDMKKSKIPPCIDTFNAVLKAMTDCDLCNNTLVDKVLNEMHALGIEPTFATWKGVVLGSKLPANAKRRCIRKIFDLLEEKEVEAKTADDYAFFHEAIQMLGLYELADSKLCMRLVSIREKLGTGAAFPLFSDNTFYRTYFRTIAGRVPFEVLMQEYSKVSPFRFCPDRMIFKAVLEELRAHEAFEYLPQVWEDFLFLMPIKDSPHITGPLFKDLARKKYDEKNQTEFLKMADQILGRWKMTLEDEKTSARFGQVLNGLIIGYFIQIALNSDDLNKAWEFYQEYTAAKHTLTDHPDEKAYITLFDACLQKRDTEKFMTLISTMKAQDLWFVDDMIREAKASLDASKDETQRSMLESLWF